jgi:exopolyphosphatase / guanosine-5'-triphosphate,3'-diphosphate pyrophosphatase
MEHPQRLAVIDMGSNSFRLVIFTANGCAWERTKELSEPVRIGEGLSATGRLGRRPMERALKALTEFADVCRSFDLEEDEIDVVATSAIRDAENSAEFLEWAREREGLQIRVLSREAEAWYGYLAAVNSTTLVNGCVIDLGGGSLQLVRVVDRLARETGSWRLGTVRMTERFLSEAPTEPARIQDLREYVDIELEQAHWLPETGWRVVGLGGTIRNLAATTSRALGVWRRTVQGTVVERAALEDLIERLASMTVAERAELPGIKPSRADLILAGAVVVERVLELGGFEGLEATAAGLREGVFFERHPPAGLRAPARC